MITPEQLDILSDAIDPDDIIMITKSSDGETKVIPAGAIVPITGTCESAASDSTKIIVLTEFSGTELPKHFYVNVTFANGNTYGDTTTTPATYPTLQFQNKDGVNVDTPYSLCDSRGHYAGTGCYNSGDKMKLECEDHNASIQNSDIRQQVNSSTNGYTIMSDGTIIHLNNQIDIKSLIISQRVTSGGTIQTYNNRKISDYRLLVIYICGAVSDIRNSLVITRQYFEEVSFVAVHSHHNVGLSDVSGFEVIYIDDTHVKVILTGQGALPYIRIDGIN